MEDGRPRRANRASRPCRTARSASAGETRGWASGTSNSATSSPALTLLGRHDELVEVDLPRFDVGESEGGGAHRRGVPAKRIGGKLVTTVFDLLARAVGVASRRAPRRVARRLRRPQPYTPAWQQEHTGVDAGRVMRVAREFARNAERTERALDDRDGRRDEPLVPLGPDLPRDAEPRPAVRLSGRERGRLGALRRAGEGASDHRLVDASRSRSTGTDRRASRPRRPSGSS